MSRGRIVYDPDSTFGYRYRARIVPSGRKFRCIIDQRFMGWRVHARSRRFRREDDAYTWGTRWLDAMEHSQDGRPIT